MARPEQNHSKSRERSEKGPLGHSAIKKWKTEQSQRLVKCKEKPSKKFAADESMGTVTDWTQVVKGGRRIYEPRVENLEGWGIVAVGKLGKREEG